jgi:nucleoside 2-deoxyribosyltransferase
MRKSLVYLAGPITGMSYGASTDWRDYAAKNIDSQIQTISPMRHKEYLANETAIASSYEKNPMSCAKGITTRDRFDCMRSDAVLVNLLGAEKVSIGTVMEVAWADSARKQIVLVIDKADKVHMHPMLTEACGYIVDNLDEALSIVERVLLPEVSELSMTARLGTKHKLAA